jgi:carbonic anhydrase
MKKYNFSKNLAIFCSDERFTKASINFLKTKLKIKVCDLFVVPGGVAFLINRERNLIHRLSLLTKLHNIKQIVIISHSDCGYYKTQFCNINYVEQKQINDLKQSVKILKKMFCNVSVKTFFVKHKNSKIIFKEIC